MLRKMLSLGALIVVAVAFGAGPAAAGNSGCGKPGHSSNGSKGTDGFSDGRLAQ